MIAKGANVNAKEAGSEKRTALILASRYRQIKIAKLLIENGADLNARE